MFNKGDIIERTSGLGHHISGKGKRLVVVRIDNSRHLSLSPSECGGCLIIKGISLIEGEEEEYTFYCNEFSLIKSRTLKKLLVENGI